MQSINTEEKGKSLEAVSATSTPTVAASKESPIGACTPSQLPGLLCPEATTDHQTSNSVSNVHSPITQSQTHPQPALVSPYTSPTVMLLVGGPASPSRETEPVPFYVHADLLTSLSPFFRAAFGSNLSTTNGNGWASSTSGTFTGFKESQTRTMSLPEERPDDVRYLLQWVYWKAAMFTSSAVVGDLLRSSTSQASSLSLKSACPLRASPSAGAAGALWHPLIDPPLHARSKYNAERTVVAKAAKHGDISQLIVPRPTPPAFGPLVRLWLLAERLDVRGGLRDEVVERVLEVSAVGNCVPGREDIGALWEGLDGGGAGKLRELVLDLFVGMRCWGLFNTQEDEEEDGPGRGQWHEGFLQELVRRLMWELHGEWRGQQGGKLEGGFEEEDVGGEGDGEDKRKGKESEFVIVGRLRRRRCDYHEHG